MQPYSILDQIFEELSQLFYLVNLPTILISLELLSNERLYATLGWCFSRLISFWHFLSKSFLTKSSFAIKQQKGNSKVYLQIVFLMWNQTLNYLFFPWTDLPFIQPWDKYLRIYMENKLLKFLLTFQNAPAW